MELSFWGIFFFRGIKINFVNLIFISDEEKLFGKFPPDAEWEEFAIVAADLLERIQSSLSYNNSAYASSEEDETNDIANNEAMNENMPKSRFDTWLASS